MVNSGIIDTPMLQMAFGTTDTSLINPDSPLDSLGRPEEVGALIVFLLSSESSFITGSTYKVDGGEHT